MANADNTDPKNNSGNPGEDQDFWLRLLAAAQTEAAKELDLSGGSGRTFSQPDRFSLDLVPGEMLLNTYRIESEKIEGGMGSVWKVHHMGWNVDLAMKRPKPQLFRDEKSKSDFINECRSWIGLGLHPNIVTCYYVREIGGAPAIFSEWMENGSLEDRILDGSLYMGTEAEVQARLADIAIQYARGLHYAHEKGLIHQDVKPDNLLLNHDWDAKAADFGLARARVQLTVSEEDPTQPDDNGATHFSSSGAYTPAYCSMEQMDGKPLTRRTDIYSWAVSMMEMYLGSRPWPNGVVAGIGCRTYLRESVLRVSMPEPLRDLISKCLAADPDERPRDFGEIEKELLYIYRKVTGNDYPRPKSKAASDTADSLNNRALSYLDMDEPEKAEKSWNMALDRDPDHVDALFNRALYMVRSGKKRDYKAIEELSRHKEVCSAGLVEVLAWDNGGSLDSVVIGKPQTNPVNFGDSRSFSYTEKEMLVFSLREKNGGQEILHMDLMTGRKLEADPMNAVRIRADEIKAALTEENVFLYSVYVSHAKLIPNSDQMLSVIFAEGIPAVNNPQKHIHSYYYLCLYDINIKAVTKAPVLLTEFEDQTSFNLKKLMIDPAGTNAMFCFGQTIGNQDKNETLLLVDLPSFRISYKTDLKFVCFLPENRCLFRGRDEKRKMALFVREKDGSLREVFKFSRVIKKNFEFWDGDIPFLCYQYSSGEIFRLDENYRKISMKRLPVNSYDAFYPLKYDAEYGLLYLHGLNALEILDLSRETLCTMPMPSGTFGTKDRMEMPYDKMRRILLLTEYSGRWAFIHLPLVCPRRAQWRLSHIVSSQERINEEKRLEVLTDRFRRCIASGDRLQAIGIHRQCCDIPGFSGSNECFDMGTVLETFAEKEKLLYMRYRKNLNKTPEFAVFAMHIEDPSYGKPDADDDFAFLSSGEFALYSPDQPRKGIRIFSRGGKLIRKVILPDVRYIAVRHDRIYAVKQQMECAVYDMEGKFIAGLLEKDNRVIEEDCPVIFDIDPDGRYLLFKYKYCARQTGVYQLDLNSGNLIRMDISGNSYYYKTFYYLNNGTAVTSGHTGFFMNSKRLRKPFTLIERYSTETGEKLPPVQIQTDALDSPEISFCVNRDRDKVFIHLSYHKESYYKKNDPDEIRVYDPDGRMLCMRDDFPAGVVAILPFPDSIFMAYVKKTDAYDHVLSVLNMLENEIVHSESVPYAHYLTFRPDCREIYWGTQPFMVYRLEFAYQLRSE